MNLRLLLGFLGLLLFICPARADRITVSITVTNKTTNGMVFTLNGDTRTFTNNVANTATQVATNADATGCGSATNLLEAIYGAPFSQVVARAGGSNSFTLVGNSGLPMNVTVTAGYAAVSSVGNTVSTMVGVRVPVSGEPDANARTNIASGLVAGINRPENTNTISQNSLAAGELLGLTNLQVVSGIKIFTNAAGQFFGIITNSPGISGTVILLSGGLLSGCTLSNSPSISGNGGVIRGGYFSNIVAEGSSFTNTQFNGFEGHNGNARFATIAMAGLDDFEWYNDGPELVLTNLGDGGSFLFSSDGQLICSSGISLLNGQPIIGTFTGNGGGVTNLNASKLTNSIPPGPLSGAIVTNLTAIGTNSFPAGADIAFGRKAITSLANGGNSAIPIGTNVFVEFSGPTAAWSANGFANGRDGKLLVALNQSGQVMTIANESGVDPVAVNRIRTLTGADLATAANSICVFIYSGSASRWILVSAGTVTTVTNVNASQITGSISASQIYNPITYTNFVLNQIYTNTSGNAISLHGLASLTTAAVVGTSELDLMSSTNGGSSFFILDGPKIITAVSGATGAYQSGINGNVQTNGIYYFTNSSAGAGDSSTLVSGSGQVTGL